MDISDSCLSLQVFDRVFARLNLPDLFKVSISSKYFFDVVKLHLHARFATLLGEYVTNVPLMEQLMSLTDVVISGARAFEFVMPSQTARWTNDARHLDFYAPHDGEHLVLEALLEDEGYAYSTPPFDYGQSDSPNVISHGVTRIITLSHPGRQKTIHVIVSHTSSALTPIFTFHSTAVMNWVTAKSVTVAYPKLTFAERGIVGTCNFRHSQTPDDILWQALDRYQMDRFFDLKADPSLWMGIHECGTIDECLQTIRQSDDRGTAFLAFGELLGVGESGYYKNDRRWGVYDGALWRLGGKLCVLGTDEEEEYGEGMVPFQAAAPGLSRNVWLDLDVMYG